MTTEPEAASLGRRLLSRLDQAATYSRPGAGVTRLYCSDEHQRLLPLLEAWMGRAGLEATLDAAGTLVGRCPRARAGEPTLILGSHQDSVIEGGKYDGMLGIALPLLALETLREQGIELPFGVEVVAFGDEEGVRFPSTLVGSRALAGTFDPAMLDGQDDDGISLRDALAGLGVDPSRIHELARDPDRVIGFVEVHIEQGPVLEHENLSVGVVTALTGIERHRIRVSGKAGHAGTTPMKGRHDALVGAAEMVVEIDRQLNALDAMVGVVGHLDVRPNAVNVIPSEVTFTLELRAPQRGTRHAARHQILTALESIATARGLQLAITPAYEAEGVECAPWLIESLEEACQACGQRPKRLFSGAGHDGLAMHDLTDIGMLFVRCRDGLSHHPDEAITADDAGMATRVIMAFLEGMEVAYQRN
ncbi:allantoate amidohydrolase [Aidingimonas halophila]|uniref:Allantoate deiminase n=1 Tax=Aidingimonas halophila TaxID=574349 RepID=A0A1H2RR10_9GAMM|nr:allantoate amidohydrolase [Aidingimonas halophila]GHC18856.1 Zn-dependent hydrolase [Aidingimonas halophila]SDW21738.1 allantoate deiminase [Aidingimonas halophila]